MKRLHCIALACLIGLIWSCNGGSEKASKEMRAESPATEEKKESATNLATPPTKQEEPNPMPPMATSSNLKQTNKQFIRTADVRFQVKNVYKTTLELEKMVASYKGFITENNLTNQVTKTEEMEVSRDSILRVVMHQVNNSLTIRLPQDTLDIFLHQLGKWVVFLDQRIVKAEDVTLALKAHELRANRYQKHESRYTKTIDNKGQEAKLNETTSAEDQLLQRQNEADANLMQKEGMQDQVMYCTVRLQIYQPETIHRSMMENYRKIEQYKPNFWSKVGEGFAYGWNGFLNFLVGITHIWVLLLWIGIGLGVYLRFRTRNK